MASYGGKKRNNKKTIIIGSIAAVVVLAGIAIYFFIQNQHKDEKCFSVPQKLLHQISLKKSTTSWEVASQMNL